MRAARTIVAVAAVTLVACTVGCTGAGDTRPTDDAGSVNADGGVRDATGDGAGAAADAMTSGTTATGGSPSAVAGIRVANWSPDAPPIDLCVAAHATGAFRGPLLGGLLEPEDGGADGGAAVAALFYPYASAYTYVPPGQYDARLVPAGAPDCTGGIGADVTNLPALLPDGNATIALLGEVNPSAGRPGLRLAGFLDDPFATTGTAALRFINAVTAPSMALADLGEEGNNGSFNPIFLAVHFGQAGTAPSAGALVTAVDANGFGATAELSSATLSLRARNGAADLLTASGVNIAAGAVVTIVGVGAGSMQLVECVDDAPAVNGYMGKCSVISAAADAGGR
jgi:hypothetical protein